MLPIIAFTIVEEKYGIIAGLVTGMVFGLCEIVYELIRFKKVSTMTWVGNGMLLGLGGISLLSSDGIWFKLQPALIEFGFFVFLLGSWLMKRPFLVMVIEKQNPDAPKFLKNCMKGMTFRLSLFFLGHAALATWAAFKWTNEAWAILKGVGLTMSMVVYMIFEVLWARRQAKQQSP